jgi:protein-arginine kinase activator protein McsA
MAQHCIRCGESPAYLREYEDYKGNKASFYHCDDCATQAYRYFRREARDHERDQAEAKERKEQAEQAHKDREYKLSHCQQCGKKSSVYHYIYDKRTGKLTSSTSNATDADNQIIFCTKEHFQNWLRKKLSKIYENNKRNKAELEKNKEKLEELLSEQEELQRELSEEFDKEALTIICAKCGQSKEGKH